MRYLNFDTSESGDGVITLEALAATPAAQHAAVMAEVQQVLAWAERHFPDGQAPPEEGGHWLHDLQLGVEDGGWHSVALSFSASATFAAEFLRAFGEDDG